MLKQKFAAGHQGPKKVFDDGAAFGSGRGSEDGQQSLAFTAAGRSGEAEQIGFVDESGVVFFEKLSYSTFFVS